MSISDDVNKHVVSKIAYLYFDFVFRVVKDNGEQCLAEPVVTDVLNKKSQIF